MGCNPLPHTTPSAVITGLRKVPDLSVFPASLAEVWEVADEPSETPQECKRNVFLSVISQVAGSTRGLCVQLN